MMKVLFPGHIPLTNRQLAELFYVQLSDGRRLRIKPKRDRVEKNHNAEYSHRQRVEKYAKLAALNLPLFAN